VALCKSSELELCCFAVLSVSTNSDISEGPNVETALSMSPTTAMITAESHKPTIGSRKQATAKKGVKLTHALKTHAVAVLYTTH